MAAINSQCQFVLRYLMTFQQVLDKYRKISFSEKDKGYRFERLMQAYLQTGPLYASRFSKVRWSGKCGQGESNFPVS